METSSSEHLTIRSPKEAAEILATSPATLRRMARSYERYFEQLPRNDRNDRLWPAEALERLEAARALREAGKVPSLEAGLKLIAEGAESPQEALERARAPEPWELVLGELQALRRAVERLEAENRVLSERLDKALPSPQEERRPWWRLWGGPRR